VLIEDGAWLGQNSVILGATIGAGAVVAANSVVLEDVPPRTVAAGAPAKVVRELTS
jgi:acetyltransferase-like isoleucine patch superfamily enzyme